MSPCRGSHWVIKPNKTVAFLLQEFDFFLVCVLVMSLVLFVCYIVSLDECLQI